ncbi:MAG: AAA-like domain-containing protein [Anaerolineae bacterium]|nr:AAA-like domain-containing protein [Anaerolineae bacterium]
MIGKRIGKYQIQELLGKGGMGEVYRASHPTLERDVAIKLIHLHHTGDSAVADRFRREAKVVAALRHSGIIQVYDFDIDEDMLYMVMEYVSGESLAQRLAGIHAQGGQLSLEEALRLFRLITQAVAYAHQQGVIHCDLKPGNVLLTTQGQPVLTDFGIAKFVTGERLTLTADIMGTPHYMSPEQASGGKVGPYTDVYALGVILFELTTGVLPFSGDTAMSIVFRHVNEPPPPPRSVNPNLPEPVEKIIQQALNKDPQRRYPSAQEMLADVEAFIIANAYTMSKPACLFICHKHHTEPDHTLATHLYQALTARGQQICIDPDAHPDSITLEEIEEEIQASDFFVVLLSESAADSEMVIREIGLAYRYHQARRKPTILPVRIAYDGPLPYAGPAILQPIKYIDWHSEADNNRVVEEILQTISGQFPLRMMSAWDSGIFETSMISEDGRLIPRHQVSAAPLPAFDPRFLKELVVPGGATILRDKLYVERKTDDQLKDQIVKWGTTITIRAPRQTGKTSLLMRGIHHARTQGINVVFLDFQSFGSDQLSSLDLFLQEFAQSICDELVLDEDIVEQAWQGSRSPTKKLSRFMEQYVLPDFDDPIVLAMDEADGLLQTDFYKDFFGLLRSWHNRRASREVWEKLNLVLVISTEPYLLIDDIHQSPFNVGLFLGLEDFNEAQVQMLNDRHGSPVAENHLPDLMALLNGHPFLTRLALYKMVVENISWASLRQNAAADAGPFGDHLRHQYWTIHDKPALKNALRDIILTNCCPDEKSLFRLLQAGLIKGSGDVYTCRCDLYRLYFKDKLFI